MKRCCTKRFKAVTSLPRKLSNWIILFTCVAVLCIFIYKKSYERQVKVNSLAERKWATIGESTASIGVGFQEIHGNIVKEAKASMEMSTTRMSGTERAEYLRKACQKLTQTRYKLYSKHKVRVSYSEKHNTLYCPLCKLASTFWTRVFVMLEKNRDSHIVAETPFDIPIAEATPSNKFYNLDSHIVSPENKSASDSFKYLFVRSPFAFLYSAFVDKLVAANPAMWKTYGYPAILRSRGEKSLTCGSDVTFEEYIDYTVFTLLQKGYSPDCHTAKFTECSPCALNYTYVAQMETFSADTYNILTYLNQTNTINRFRTSFKELHAEDAIEDTIGQVNNRDQITKCIPWPQALRRMWRKLQLRGIIGPMPFPLTDTDAMFTNRTAFMALARKAQKLTTFSEKKTLKTEGFNEAYSALSAGMFKKLYKVYEEEMVLFGYKPIDLTATRHSAERNKYRNYFNYDKDLEIV